MKYIILVILIILIFSYIVYNKEHFKTIKCSTINPPSEFKRGSTGNWKKTCTGKKKCEYHTINCNNQINLEGGEYTNNEGYCIPSNLKDIFLIVLFPPLWVFLKELNSPNKNFINVMYNILFTSFFYFPGLIHAMNLMRLEGTI
jgi:uncharacterized membrane protein YqaE (UPF0057 family)